MKKRVPQGKKDVQTQQGKVLKRCQRWELAPRRSPVECQGCTQCTGVYTANTLKVWSTCQSGFSSTRRSTR